MARSSRRGILSLFLWLAVQIWLLTPPLGVEAYPSSHQILESMYCGEENCYDALGVEPNATQKTIKKAFRRLSIRYHPDRNPGAEAHERFQLIARAHEVLSNEDKRESYDYYLSHPDSLVSIYYGFRAIYPRHSNPLVVVSMCLAFVSLLQYVNFRWKRERMKSSIQNSQVFKKAVSDEIAEQYGPKFKRMKSDEQLKVMQEAAQVVLARVQVDGEHLDTAHDKFDWSRLLILQVLTLPLTVVNWVVWNMRWFWLFTYLNKPYGVEERLYMTRRALEMTSKQWQRLEDDKKEELLQRELWMPENFKVYKKEVEEEERVQRVNSARYRQQKRWRRNYDD